MPISVKSIFGNEPDRSSELNKFVADRTNRSDMAMAVKRADLPADAPCFEMAYELTPDQTKYVYKVNCPGWLYVAYKNSSFKTSGNVTILLASSPSNLNSSSSRLLYLQGYNDYNKNANTIVPVHPGTSTYMFINADTSNKTVYFVPAAISVAMNIYEPSYAERLYSVTWSHTTGKQVGTSCSEIFSGDWKDNFKSLAGVWVMDENNCEWPSSDPSKKSAFIAARKQWLEDLGVDSTQWGYP